MGATQTSKPKIYRAASYCRTSGKDKTSISSQKEANERFIKHNKWKFVGHYIDEHKSGANVAARDDYQKALKDLANDEFDILVPFDISRFGRDGLDIIRDSEMLRRNFGKFVVDSKGQFDNRTHRRVMTNFIFAGVAEDERLRIMERTIRGRIANAEKGIPWSANSPDGRDYDKKTGKWYINDKGKMLQKLLPRYAKGQSLASLAREFGIKFPETVTRTIRTGQLSGIYKAMFNSPEIGIHNLEIPVRDVPPVITAELETQCRERAAHNHKWNKRAKRKYLLSSFLYCEHCGHSLKGRTEGRVYYTHYYKDSKLGCPYCSIRADLIEPVVFDYLFNFFLDEPAYNEAIKNAMPNDSDRQALELDIKQIDKQIAQVKTEIKNLVNAIAQGAEPNFLISKQNELKNTLQTLENKRDELEQTLANMPDLQRSQLEAELLRLELIYKYGTQDWRDLSYEQIRRFLHYLFSDNPKKNHYGIFISRNKKGKFEISFEGSVEFLPEEELYQKLIERADSCLETIAKLEAKDKQSVKRKTLNSLRVG